MSMQQHFKFVSVAIQWEFHNDNKFYIVINYSVTIKLHLAYESV